MRRIFLLALLLFLALAGAVRCNGTRLVPPLGVIGRTFGFKDSLYAFVAQVGGAGDDVSSVRFDWGDGDTSDWQAQADTSGWSGIHAWRTGGQYEIRAQSRNERGEVSGWCAPLGIRISARDYPSMLMKRIPIPTEDDICELAVVANGRFLYARGWLTNCMSVVDLDLGVYVGEVDMGQGAGWSYINRVVVSPSGDRAYANNYRYESLAVVNTSTHTVIAGVAGFDWYTDRMVVLPNGDYLYAGTLLDTCYGLRVLRTSDNCVVAEVPLFDECEAMLVACLPDGKSVYAAGTGEDSIYTICTAENTVVDVQSMSDAVVAMVPSADGQYLYVGLASDEIAVVRLSDYLIVATLPVDISLFGIFALTPDGRYLCAGVYDEGRVKVYVIRTADNVIVDVFILPYGSRGVAFSPDGQRMYVGCDDGVFVLGY